MSKVESTSIQTTEKSGTVSSTIGTTPVSGTAAAAAGPPAVAPPQLPADSYPPWVGFVFVFNLILGTGVLTMPAVFAKSGYVIGIIVIVALCFVSYLQTTYLIETMASANFVARMKAEAAGGGGGGKKNRRSRKSTSTKSSGTSQTGSLITPKGSALTDVDQNSPKPNLDGLSGQEQCNAIIAFTQNQLGAKFEITEKFELSAMSEMFLQPTVVTLFFLSMLAYLYGDLVIYNTMMTKSLRELSCTSSKHIIYRDSGIDQKDFPCWDSMSLTRRTVFRIYLVMFISALIPLTYAGIKKTKSIQVATILLRWLAFASMFGICLKMFIKGEANGHPNMFDIAHIPKLFGVCVYSFMCHHSLPSIITPIRDKRSLTKVIIGDYTLVIIFYLIIAITGIFAFSSIADVYTLNFQANFHDESAASLNATRNGELVENPAVVPVLNIFLPTFPIFTQFSSYTFITFTLINNLKVLLCHITDVDAPLLRNTFPLIAILPPAFVSLFTENVSSVVHYVGSYSGSLIQYVFPSLLVYYSRKKVQEKYLEPYLAQRTQGVNPASLDALTPSIVYASVNHHGSPFQHNIWVLATLIWWIISLLLVTSDYLTDMKHVEHSPPTQNETIARLAIELSQQ